MKKDKKNLDVKATTPYPKDYILAKKACIGMKKTLTPEENEEFQSMNIRMKPQPLRKKAIKSAQK